MRSFVFGMASFLCLVLLSACGGPTPETITFDKSTNTQVAALGTVDYTITGLTDTQAYRITLVVDANVTASGATGTFMDKDSNGAADAGASENVALITMVNGKEVANGGAKTVPGGTDDPSAPSGVFPSNGTITLTVKGVASGKVYPVIYHNGGQSTFLEIGSDGKPTETYAVGGSVEVTGSAKETFVVEPATDSSIAADGTVELTVSGLTDKQAYRITLVVDGNVTVSGNMGTFVDNDSNGAADAGASEKIALITKVNGNDVDSGGAKTVPGGADDPSSPSGVFPSGGKITLTIKGVAAGKVYPVIYHNGGSSTFLEVGTDGKPIETYFVANAIEVK